MSDSEAELAQAVEYLRDAAQGFWRWDDGGRAVAWADGRTIAFRGEIVTVLRRLAPLGLPAFEAVVLLLAACRDGFFDWPPRAIVLKSYTSPDSVIDRRTRLNRSETSLDTLLDALGRLSNFPSETRRSPPMKCVIAESVFEGGVRLIPPALAAAVISTLESDILFLKKEDPNWVPIAESLFLESVKDLSGIAKLDANALLLRAKTGFDALPRPAPLEEALPSIGELLAKLRTDDELGGLARVAQRLLAVAEVPRPLHAREELPIGGVSDLSNRGTFDRLLLSELAHDDLTLAARVAMNEALYLRRESPPGRPPPRRKILIDVGIRLWGLPRAFATAAALAFAATADGKAQTTAFRSDGAGAVSIDLASREGIVALLEALEPSPHPAVALRELLQRGGEDNESADTLLITHPDVVCDPEFWKALVDVAGKPFFLATVQRDGAFELIASSRAGRKTLRTANVSLDELFAAATPYPLAAESHPIAPAFVLVKPCPLRLPRNLMPQTIAVSSAHGLFGLTRLRALVQFDGPLRGAKEWAANVPHDRFLGLFIDDELHAVLLVTYERSRVRLHTVHVDLTSGVVTRASAPCERPTGAWYRFGLLFIASHTEVAARRPMDLFVTSTLAMRPRMTWRRDRFFTTASLTEVATIGFDGYAPALEIFRKPVSAEPFERAGRGLWFLNSDGNFEAGDGAEKVRPEAPFTQWTALVGVSADGERLAVHASDGRLHKTFHFDFAKPDRWTTWHPPVDVRSWLAGPKFQWSHGSIQTRGNFNSVFVNATQQLGLVRHKKGVDQAFVFGTDAAGVLKLAPGKMDAIGERSYFATRKKSYPREFGLRVATFNNGSRAYLDPRGLLHLKSIDRRLPEITVTLASVPVAGWTSEGQTFGWSYFLEDKPTTTPAFAADVIRRFAQGVL